jgi:enoyl-CoA hydratase/carnithine racemase
VTDQLRVEHDGPVLVLTLNRPEKRNAITHEMVRAWTDALIEARTDPQVRVVVVTGADPAFCSGADFSMMRNQRAAARQGGNGTPADAAADAAGGDDQGEAGSFVHRVAIAMDDLDKPVIAAVNGPAVGAGLGMALMADLRFMSDTARVAEGYINVGIFPGDGDTYYLPRLIGTSRALMMFWTGDFVDAAQCLSMGIADKVIQHDLLMTQTMEFAQRLATRPQAAIRAVKRATYASLQMNLRDSLGMIGAYSRLVGASPDRRKTFEEFISAHPDWHVGA